MCFRCQCFTSEQINKKKTFLAAFIFGYTINTKTKGKAGFKPLTINNLDMKFYETNMKKHEWFLFSTAQLL